MEIDITDDKTSKNKNNITKGYYYNVPEDYEVISYTDFSKIIEDYKELNGLNSYMSQVKNKIMGWMGS